MELNQLYDGFRDPETIKALADSIHKNAQKLEKTLHVMEVCGGHTHTIMKYGLNQLMPENVEFIHGPGCPVCVMPKERIDQAAILARQSDVILLTLGDMIKVPGSEGSLQKVRAEGADVRFIYSPMDVLEIAVENPDKKIIYFAIGFETTTPMTAALLERVIEQKLENVFFHINHITVPEPVMAIMDSGEAKINAFIGPSHVSVIAGAKIYQPIVEKYHTPVVVAGFEPVDVMESVNRLILQTLEGKARLDIEYTRSVNMEGNLKAQEMIERYFEKRSHFRWRGIGDIPDSALQLKEEYARYDAEKLYADCFDNTPIDDHKLCICGDILKGVAKPHDCKVFGSACTPQNPLGSCMVSSEGACAAYYKYSGTELATT